MKLYFAWLMCFLMSAACAQQESYPVPAEAKPIASVPKGTIHGPFEFRSRIFPGTIREYWVYEPAGYSPEQPPCLMVVQDGLNRAKGWKLPTVLDNLIHTKQVPPQLGIFVSPGVVPAASDDAQPRFNRSFEYDSMGDRYSRFLMEELLPEVSQRWKFSDDPNDRCIAGSSSGAICAFTVAWERPDAFRRVFSTVGTYVGLRGGNEYPTLIRKTERKPIRVFLQDGSNDLDIYAGSWWNANQTMLSALQFSGYEVKHVWGEGGHNAKHGAAILPEALKWLWKDHPKPIQGSNEVRRRTQVLIEGENWKLAPQDSAPARLADPTIIRLPDETQYRINATTGNQIERVNSKGVSTKVAQFKGPLNSLIVSPDKTTLTVASRHSRFLTSFRIAANGRLKFRQTYGWLHLNDDLRKSIGGMAVDTEGFTYVPTDLGIQVLDQLGRVHFIIQSPDSKVVEAVAFGGPKTQTLFAKVGDRIFQRKLQRTGVPPSAAAVKPPKPRL